MRGLSVGCVLVAAGCSCVQARKAWGKEVWQSEWVSAYNAEVDALCPGPGPMRMSATQSYSALPCFCVSKKRKERNEAPCASCVLKSRERFWMRLRRGH